MPTINLAYVAELILKYARKYAYFLAVFFFYTILASAMASFVASFVIFYDLANSFINLLANGSSNDLVNKFYGLLTCIGFTQALNDTKSLLISAFLFMLFRIVFASFLKYYYLAISVSKPLVK